MPTSGLEAIEALSKLLQVKSLFPLCRDFYTKPQPMLSVGEFLFKKNSHILRCFKIYHALWRAMRKNIRGATWDRFKPIDEDQIFLFLQVFLLYTLFRDGFLSPMSRDSFESKWPWAVELVFLSLLQPQEKKLKIYLLKIDTKIMYEIYNKIDFRNPDVVTRELRTPNSKIESILLPFKEQLTLEPEVSATNSQGAVSAIGNVSFFNASNSGSSSYIDIEESGHTLNL